MHDGNERLSASAAARYRYRTLELAPPGARAELRDLPGAKEIRRPKGGRTAPEGKVGEDVVREFIKTGRPLRRHQCAGSISRSIRQVAERRNFRRILLLRKALVG